MPRSPSAPKEPYLKCSSSFAKTSFSSRKNFVHVNHAPDASKITIPITEIHRMRLAFAERLIVICAFCSRLAVSRRFATRYQHGDTAPCLQRCDVEIRHVGSDEFWSLFRTSSNIQRLRLSPAH